MGQCKRDALRDERNKLRLALFEMTFCPHQTRHDACDYCNENRDARDKAIKETER